MSSTKSCLSIFLIMLYWFIMSMTVTNLTTDQSTLLEFKRHIFDPRGYLNSNWSSTSSVCQWIGVSCGAGHERVTVLDISDMNLEGTIVPQLANLSFLVSFNVRGNNFNGYLPKELTALHRLELIDLRNNAFNGEIPAWIGNLTKLKAIYLSGNSFQGEIPVEIGNLIALETFAAENMSLITGPIPASIFNISSLKEIYLSNNSLSGSIPDDMCRQLRKLEVFYVYQNELSGHVPSNIGECSSLQNLSLSINKFSGFIPQSIGNLTRLDQVYLGLNSLEGDIPSNIGECKNLQLLSLKENRLSGTIPRSIGNLTRLKDVFLDYNDLNGEIPWEIGNLITLEVLSFPHMRLGGLIPHSIFNISSLKIISLQNNSLFGELPWMIQASNLEELRLWENNLIGNIPDFMSNVSKLRILSLNLNSLSGFIPNTLGKLTSLEVLRLWSNELTTKNPTNQDLAFLSSLTNCKKLRVLQLSSNPLNGILPTSISNLSTALEEFEASDCKIEGNIPLEIGNLSNIMSLTLSQNELIGSIPPTIGRLRNVQGLYLDNNNLKGSIPYNVCQLESLNILELSGNMLQGPIPMCLGDLTSLRSLYLNSNRLDSTIPLTFWSLRDILIVDLSSNYLQGSLSLDIGNLKVLTYLNLSKNLLSSDIPITVGSLNSLQTLSLSSNRLQGPIPKSLGSLPSLETLDLSDNNLSGIIPKSLEGLSYLRYFNVASNKLEGEIPTEGCFQNFTSTSFMNNYALCGSPRLQVPPCKSSNNNGQSKTKHTRVLTYVLPAVASIIVIVTFIIVFRQCQYRGRNISINEGLTPEIESINLYNRLLQATDSFSEANLLGSGSFGSVYKGILSDGKNVAIKVFNLQFEGAFKSFEVECEVMQNILHRNLVKVISCCSCIDFKALVLEFYPNGSLDKWLYCDHYFLDILQRINIMIDVGSALEYLHLGHPNPIIHCDLKPSNVLLDKDMVAHVGDFGISKLLGEAESMKQTMTLATIGYMAPEYGSTGIVSTKSDVYSYGILLMETFTKKKPTSEFFVGEMNMRHWVEVLLSNGTNDVADYSLLQNEAEEHFMATTNCVSSIMRLALDCSAELPEERKDMKDVVSMLMKIKTKFLNNVCRT
ncbi:hypothetical protein DITRI_Ditri11bG0007700 [Diplodiscus trichospermus]